jgi:hypothetical protein
VLFNENRSQVIGIEYIRYENPAKRSPIGSRQVAVGRLYVLAANAIETPRLLLSSDFNNSSLGANLMDHPFFLQWGLASKQVYPFRGPLSTSGIESLRDRRNRLFRKDHSAFRIEIGNDGWALSAFDPARTTLDWIDGTNTTETNSAERRLYGRALRETLNGIFTRQCRIGFELEQLPLEPSLYAFAGRQRRLLLIGFHRRMASSIDALAASLENVAARLRRLQTGLGSDDTVSNVLRDLEDEDEVDEPSEEPTPQIDRAALAAERPSSFISSV